MKYLSLFSGIEAASVAWHDLGWDCVGFSEIEPFPCSLLAIKYTTVPNLGDVTKITEEDIKNLGQFDGIVFGSPCQDLSLAGKRKGFQDGTRSNLFFSAIRIIQWARKHCGLRWALWENVAGAFSSNKGADFASVVEYMAGCGDVIAPPNGWGNEGAAVGEHGMLEWSTLDAQWFGVAQRRRRVFAFADFGDWSNRPPVLLERRSMRGDTPTRAKTGEEVAGTITSSIGKRGGVPDCGSTHGLLQPVTASRLVAFGEYVDDGTASTMQSRDFKGATDLIAYGFQPRIARNGRGDMGETVHALSAQSGETGKGDSAPCVAYGIPGNWIGRAPENGGNATEPMHDVAPCLTGTDRHRVAYPHTDTMPTLRAGSPNGGAGHGARSGDCKDEYIVPTENFMKVRRLTPTECERLQGFPDEYTNIKHRNKLAADGNRYKALGNSFAVRVIKWIGVQINRHIKTNQK